MNPINPTSDLSTTTDQTTFGLPTIEDCRQILRDSGDSRVSPSQRNQRLVRSELSSSNIDRLKNEENKNCDVKSAKKRIGRYAFEEKLAKMQQSSFRRRFSRTSNDYDFQNFVDHGYEFRVKNEEQDQNHFCDKSRTLAINTSLFWSIYEDFPDEVNRIDEIHKNPNNLNIENDEETDVSVSSSANDDYTKLFQICEDFAVKICELRQPLEIEEDSNVEDIFLANLNKLFIDNRKSIEPVAQFMKIMRNEKLCDLATAGRIDKHNCRLNRSLCHSRNLKSFFIKLIALCNSGSKPEFTLRFNWFLILNLPDYYFSDYLKLLRIVDFENPNFLWQNFLEFSQLLNENQSFDHKQLDILKLLAQFFEESEEILLNLYDNNNNDNDNDVETKNSAGDIPNDTTLLIVEPKFFSEDDADERHNSRFLQLFCKIRSYFKRHKVVVLSMPKFSNYSNVEEYAQMLGKCSTEKIREVKGSLVLVCWSSMCSLAMRVASKVLFSALVCFSCPMSAPVVQEQIIQYSKTNIPTIFIVGEKAVVDVDLSFLKEKDENFAVICARNSRFDLNMDVGKLCTENVTQNLIDEQLMLYIHRFLSKALPCRLKAE